MDDWTRHNTHQIDLRGEDRPTEQTDRRGEYIYLSNTRADTLQPGPLLAGTGQAFRAPKPCQVPSGSGFSLS
jgi:hypothetical protein